MRILSYILLLSLIVSVKPSFSQKKPEPPTSRILFVFDASNSMLGTWESDKKINIARKYLINIIDSLENFENIQMALRVYGHQRPVTSKQDCNDTRLEVPFADNNEGQIRQKLRYLNPKGTTPIANSLRATKKDFTPCDNCRNIIILVTDGIEACDGDPCLVAHELQKEGIVLKPFVIGIGTDPNFAKTFECVGHFYNTPNEDKFEEVLGVVISRALNSTTAQVNLLDEKGLPTETDVSMTFFDNYSGKIKHNYIHTINYVGLPDTIVLDPLMTYDLVVHTIPERRKDSIRVVAGKHTMIGLSTPQGNLKMTCSSNLYKDLNVIIREKGKSSTLNVQNIGETGKYITGRYDLEVLSIPRLYIEDVEIKQSETTFVEIPKPGIANISMSSNGYGNIFSYTKDSFEHVYTLDENKRRESVVLQPGTYKIVFRAKNSKKTIYSITKTFTIKSGASRTIVIQ